MLTSPTIAQFQHSIIYAQFLNFATFSVAAIVASIAREHNRPIRSLYAEAVCLPGHGVRGRWFAAQSTALQHLHQVHRVACNELGPAMRRGRMLLARNGTEAADSPGPEAGQFAAARPGPAAENLRLWHGHRQSNADDQ